MKRVVRNKLFKVVIPCLSILSLGLVMVLQYNVKASNKMVATGEAITTINSYEQEGLTTYLGYGYNVIKKDYINADDVSKTNTIFKIIDKETEEGTVRGIRNTDIIVDNASNDVETYYINARSVESFVSEFNSKFASKANVTDNGNWTPFSVGVAAEASTALTNNKSTRKKSEYVKDIREVKVGTAVWALDESEYYEYLSENFKRDIIDLEPEEIFEKYGTHFLRSVVLGGRLELNAAIESDSSENLTKAVASFKASMNASGEKTAQSEQATSSTDDGSTGAKTNNKTDGKTTVNAEIDSSLEASINEVLKYGTIDISSKCYGGEAKDFTSYINSTAKSVLDSDNNISSDVYGASTSLGTAYSQWLNTVRTRPALVDIYDEDSLYPIWNLLDYFVENDDSLSEEFVMERKEELKAAFEKYGKDNYDKIMSSVDDEKNKSLYATMDTTVTGVVDGYGFNKDYKLSDKLAAIHEGYKLGNFIITNAAKNEDGSMTSNSDSFKIMYQVTQDLDRLPVGTSNEQSHTTVYDTHFLGNIKGYGDVIDKWMAKDGAYYVQIIYKDQTTEDAFNNNVFKGLNKNDSIVLFETDPNVVDEHGGIDKINVLMIYETASTKNLSTKFYNWLQEGNVSFK